MHSFSSRPWWVVCPPPSGLRKGAQAPFWKLSGKDELANLNIIGSKRKPAAQKALDIAQLKPEKMAGDFSLDDFEKGMELIFSLEGKVSYPLMSLFEVVEESRFFFSDKAWDQARKVKIYIETANRTDPGLDSMVKELSEHFKQTPADDQPDDTGPQPPVGE